MEKGQVETSEIPSHPSAKIVNKKQYGIPGETEKACATTEETEKTCATTEDPIQ